MDVAEEGSGISEGAVRKFVPTWLEWFVQRNFDKWVKGIGSLSSSKRWRAGDFGKMKSERSQKSRYGKSRKPRDPMKYPR